MAIRYDPSLIRALASELRRRWRGRRVTGVWFGSEDRALRIGLEREEGGDESLVFRLHPSAGHALHESSAVQISDRGTWHRFRRLLLADVVAPPDERLLVLEIAGGLRDVYVDRPPVFRLYVELHTNQWNAVLARGETDTIEDVLWPRTAGGRTLRKGRRYVRPEGARRWAATPPTPAEWRELLAPLPPEARRGALLSGAAWTSSVNVDWLLGAAADRPDIGLLDAALDRYERLRADPGDEAWVLERAAAAQPYPLRLGETATPCAGVLDAMRLAAGRPAPAGGATTDPRASPAPESAGYGAELVAELQRRIERVRRRIAALERQLEGDDAERLREIGHLLLARQGEIPRGSERIQVQGFDGTPTELVLDPRLDAVENAERVYERARRRARAAAGLPDRIEAASTRLRELEKALSTAEATGPSDELWEIAGGRPDEARGEDVTRADAPTLPYRRYRSSGGLEIRVGRSAKANDDLTFRHSSPEDIWMHARQAAGAHVVLRWDRRDQQPPQADLAEAAALAALYSEARHSGLVAVDWTRRKYVRKPRKAPPGTVAPERVRTLLVEPEPDIAKRLSRED